MSKRSRLLVAGAAGLLLTALPVYAKKTPKAPMQTATIQNTGSTNTTGYQIQVSSDGNATLLTLVPAKSTSHVPLVEKKEKLGTYKFATKLFQDLDAAMPLTALPVRHGMRSASFGTQTTIIYKGQSSPDLTFASDPRSVALKADIDAITKALHVGNAPRRLIVIHADR